jgi:two-component system, chemotaxis family, response regulator Rcp1
MSAKPWTPIPDDCPILLAEDNEDDVIMTERALRIGKVKNPVYIVRDGEEAVDYLQKKGKYADAATPGIILLDLHMPKLDGFEVLSIIKKDEQLRSIPVVVLTTSDREKDVEEAYKLGCNSYIVKPVAFESFIATISKINEYWLVIAKLPHQDVSSHREVR